MYDLDTLNIWTNIEVLVCSLWHQYVPLMYYYELFKYTVYFIKRSRHSDS